jgi:hypothetical protein
MVPAAMPHTLPVPDTVAMVGSELIHTPPPVLLLSVTQLPIHTLDGPVMAPGSALTVNTLLVRQPVVAV